ncbi:ABC transporter ATP-binding protein [Halobacillus kuroshimensis]|uniref:ABC transporter ATP-binding protein n=1 Tax=Halobacillus kuroshimensis TaxID=302481 RepID=UPI000424C036|nr:ABC transporter ATP-binding protein [Halobacillus kuroshimensis]
MLQVKRVEKSYAKGGIFSKERQQVLNRVTFDCREGECLGIIGESGSGKSTLGRLILGIEKPDSGSVLFDGKKLKKSLSKSGIISVVFQNYKSSINPFFTVQQAIMEPMEITSRNTMESRKKVVWLLNQVGLPSSYLNKYPHELSGGEVQRVCIARAISTEPKCIILDEAISSLDVSIQTQILELLKRLKDTHNISYLFITHDIQSAAYICDRIIIFKNGQIEEIVKTENLKNTQSAYAKQLLKSLMIY